MPKKSPPEGALFVRLPAAAVDKLDRAADALGMRKKDLVAGLVSNARPAATDLALSTPAAWTANGPGRTLPAYDRPR